MKTIKKWQYLTSEKQNSSTSVMIWGGGGEEGGGEEGGGGEGGTNRKKIRGRYTAMRCNPTKLGPVNISINLFRPN